MDIINSIKFDGYKSFPVGSENEISIEPYISVFIGKNNCGKSSCMDVLEAVFGGIRSNRLKKAFHNLSFSTPINETYIDSCFPLNISGGEVPGNHNSYGRKFVDKNIYLDFSTNEIKNHMMTLKLSDVQPNLELPVGKNLWINMVRHYQSIFQSYCFRRINADRDVVPEKEINEEFIDSNGNGVTNLLRKFVNFSGFDEKLVEELLLDELNKIMMPDSCFKNIRIQEIEANDEFLWEIFLEEKNGKRFALSKSGSGLKTIILMLVN